MAVVVVAFGGGDQGGAGGRRWASPTVDRRQSVATEAATAMP